MEKVSEIQQFFNGRSVFITGGTGFIGKAVIEKLLRSCPGVESVYVLIREKKGMDAYQRLTYLLSEPIFGPLRNRSQHSVSKVLAVPGDIKLPMLGINEGNLRLLRETVSVVIHAAATVRFDEPLEVALNINLGGTSRLLDLAESMHNIQAVVYVSTAFSNCERPVIDEKVYPVRMDPKGALDLPSTFNKDLLQSITPELLHNKPNTYTLTKHLAEELLNQRKTTIPVCIVRPSIVSGALQEPIPGFVDNFNAISGLLAGIMSGVVHTILVNDEFKLDIIPLDYVVNLLLAAACRLGNTLNRSKELQIYNLTSYENPYVTTRVVSAGFESFEKNPVGNMVWYPFVYFTDNRMLNRIQDFLFHYLPAYLLDASAGLMGKKQVYLALYHKLSRNVEALQYFCTEKWEFSTTNTKRLYASLPISDRRNFPFNVLAIDWNQYVFDQVDGIRMYALKDKSDPKEALGVLSRKKQIHNVSKMTVILISIMAIFLGTSYATVLIRLLLSKTGVGLKDL